MGSAAELGGARIIGIVGVRTHMCLGMHIDMHTDVRQACVTAPFESSASTQFRHISCHNISVGMTNMAPSVLTHGHHVPGGSTSPKKNQPT